MEMFKQWRKAREQHEAETRTWTSDERTEQAARAEGYQDALHRKASELARGRRKH